MRDAIRMALAALSVPCTLFLAAPSAWAMDQCPPGSAPSAANYAPVVLVLVVGGGLAVGLVRQDRSGWAVLVGILTFVGFMVAVLAAGFGGTCSPG